jgi:integrase-like protein
MPCSPVCGRHQEAERAPRNQGLSGAPALGTSKKMDFFSPPALAALRSAMPVIGGPYHPMTQGKIERYHRSMKNRILLENYNLPGQLEHSIEELVEYYTNSRYHESPDNLMPADVYFGRGQAILDRREKIKRKTIKQRRRLHQQAIAA